MKQKKSFLLMLSLILVFSLVAACSSGSSGNPETSPTNAPASSTPEASGDNGGEPEPVTLRIAWWGSQGRHDYTQEVIKQYQEKNKHVTIEAEFANWDEYWQRLATQAASNTLPDIIQMDLSVITQYSERGQLLDLQPYLDNGTINTDNISDTVLSGGVVDGKLYGLSLGANALGLPYNPEILAAAGVELPSKDWTYDDLEKLAGDLQAKGYFLSGPPNSEEFFHYFLRTKGSTLFAADGTGLGYEDDALFGEYFGRLQRIYDAGAIQPLDQASLITSWEEGAVAKGTAFADFLWSNQYVGLAAAAQKELDIHPLPGPGSKEGLFMKPSMFFSVTNNTKAADEAARFLDFFTNDLEANKLIKGERGVPISSAVQEALRPELSEIQNKMFDYVAWASENSTPISAPPPIGAAEVYSTLKETVEALFYKQYSLEEAASIFRQEAEAILARNQ
ncbi:ABC transporter substrate-binding protein [Paenibacillus sp. CAU 1782]